MVGRMESFLQWWFFGFQNDEGILAILCPVKGNSFPLGFHHVSSNLTGVANCYVHNWWNKQEYMCVRASELYRQWLLARQFNDTVWEILWLWISAPTTYANTLHVNSSYPKSEEHFKYSNTYWSTRPQHRVTLSWVTVVSADAVTYCY